MNILMISYFHRKRGGGGIASHIQILKQSLKERGHCVYHIASFPESHRFAKQGQGLFLVRPTLTNYVRISFWVRLLSVLYGLKKRTKIDIIHCHSTSGLPVSLLETKIPVITSIHSLDVSPIMVPRLRRGFPPRKILSAINRLLNRYFLILIRDLSENVVFVSDKTKKYIEESGITFDEEKTSVISPGINTKLFCPEPKWKVQKMFGLSGRYVVLNVGRMTAKKGQLDLIRILPDLVLKIPNIRIVFIGAGRSKLLLESEGKRLKLQRFYDVLEHVDHEDLAAYYNSADIFINTSHENESFGLTTAEAMACCVPVIVSKEASDTGLVNKDNALVYENPRDLMEKILQIYRDPDLGVQMAKRGYHTVQSYSTEAVADDVQGLYQKNVLKSDPSWFFRAGNFVLLFIIVFLVEILYSARNVIKYSQSKT